MLYSVIRLYFITYTILQWSDLRYLFRVFFTMRTTLFVCKGKFTAYNNIIMCNTTIIKPWWTKRVSVYSAVGAPSRLVASKGVLHTFWLELIIPYLLLRYVCGERNNILHNDDNNHDNNHTWSHVRTSPTQEKRPTALQITIIYTIYTSV